MKHVECLQKYINQETLYLVGCNLELWNETIVCAVNTLCDTRHCYHDDSDVVGSYAVSPVMLCHLAKRVFLCSQSTSSRCLFLEFAVHREVGGSIHPQNTGNQMGALSGTVGRGTALQARTSWIRFPMESLGFSIDIILMALVWTQPITELRTRNIS